MKLFKNASPEFIRYGVGFTICVTLANILMSAMGPGFHITDIIMLASTWLALLWALTDTHPTPKVLFKNIAILSLATIAISVVYLLTGSHTESTIIMLVEIMGASTGTVSIMMVFIAVDIMSKNNNKNNKSGGGKPAC